MTPAQFIQQAQNIFQKNADKKNAQGMSAYMKNQFSFYGIKKPEREKLTKEILRSFSESITQKQLLDCARSLWKKKEREYHYLAIDLLNKNKKILTSTAFPVIELMLLKNQWWDSIDALASGVVAHLVKEFPELQKEIKRFSTHKNFWLQRVSIIYQLPYKTNTNEQFLFHVCSLHASQKEFFVQKAIGWALRQYAKTNPGQVKHFVKQNAASLSALSKREALKHIGF